jgi:serine protease AprX
MKSTLCPRFAAVVTAAALVLPSQPAAATPGSDPQEHGWREVVVTGAAADAAAAAVASVGGRVLADLPLIDAVAATLPPHADLGPDFVTTPQRVLTLTGKVAAPQAPDDAPVSTIRATLGLPAGGEQGRGATVAVVDTGIADVPDLAGVVVDRVDVTHTGGGDPYGHGTFMAGLIAGSGASSGGAYRGVAPGADLVDVKVADREGDTDLISVLRGLQWVAHRANRIDVLNLSLASYSPLPYQVDPLAQGLEALWRRGITVVVPSGNDGAEGVASPGIDPVLLTAGGLDEAGTAARADDTVAEWSGRGPTWQGDAKPDLVAPGAHVVSLRSPGSVTDTENPGSRVGDGYFLGSGTSMATAVTSGVAAAVRAVRPRLRADAVKSLLTGTAYAADGLAPATAAGAGGLDAAAALAAAPGWKPGPANPQDDADAAVLRGDATRWRAFELALLAGDRAAAARAWFKLSPKSRYWSARAWANLDAETREWAGRAWAGRAWASGPDGTAQEWVARAWAGRAWAGRAWAGLDWTGRAWAGRAWAEADWLGRAWADTEWTGRAWAGRAWAAGTWSTRAWAWRP